MPQIAAAAVIAVKAVGTIASGVVAKAAAGNLVAQLIVEGAKFALTAGVAAIANALQPNVGNAASPDTWSPDTDAPNPVAMGRVGGVAGFIAHRAAYGPTNRYQSLVTTVSLGPIRGNWTVKFDDETTTFGTNNVATNGAHAGELWCQFRLGAQPETAHTSPTGLDAGATLPNWSSDHKMSGKATYLATFKENSKLTEYRGGLPKPSLEFDGGYVYDPRLDSTYPGGSGSCRLATPSTWVWSEDPCLWALNWAIGRWAGNNGSGVYGVPYQSKLMAGIGATLDGIDVAALVNAANVSEANGWKVSAWPTTKDGAHEVYRALLQAGGALPARNAGRISCITRGEVQSSVVTITAADTAGPVEVSLGQSRLERINTILPRYWSPDHDWQMIQIDPVTSSAYVTEDGGITRSRGVDYPYVPDKDQAAQLAYYDIADNRERFSGTVPLMPHMRRLQPGDCFTFSEPGFLLDGVKAKCLRRSVDPMSLQVTVTWRQETDAKHAAAAGETGTGTGGTGPTTPPVIEVDPPTSTTIAVTGDEVTINWVNGSALFFRTFIYYGPNSTFANAIQIGSKGGAAGEAQTATHKPGQGTWYYWLVTRSGGPGAYDLSDPVSLGSVAVTVEIDTDNLDDLNILRRPGGGSYTGDLTATEGADWTTNVLSRPTELTDGRVAAGLDAGGQIAQVIPDSVRLASDIVAFAELEEFDGAETIGFDQLTPTSVVENVGLVLRRGPMYAESENAVGDGIADDTLAIQRALNTGRDVHLTPGRTYKVTSGLTMTTNYQRLIGPSSEIVAVGNFDIITVTGASRGIELDVTVHAPDHTGGWAIKVANADRVKIRAYLVNVYGCLYVEKNNHCSVDWLYASCRGPGIKWFGDATKRSDLLVLKDVVIGIYNTSADVWGIDWDGNCHSLEIKFVAIVNAYGPAAQGGNGRGRGMICRNTSGGPPGIIARIGHLEFDYVYGDGMVFDMPAHDIDLMMPYIHSPLGGSCIKINAMDRSDDLRISGGYMGSFARYAIENATVHTVLMDGTTAIYNDAGGLGRTLGPVGNKAPRTSWDDNFYALVDTGNPILGFDANDYLLYSRGSNFWEFVTGSTRRLLIDADGAQSDKFRLDVDAYLTLSGGNPLLNFAANDGLGYDRTGDEFFFNIGGTKRAGLTSDGLRVAKVGPDANAYFALFGANPVINFDANDFMSYDRTGDEFFVNIGGVKRLGVTADGLTLSKYALDTNAHFSLSSGNPLLTFDATDFQRYDRASNFWELVIGGTQRLAVDGDGAKATGYRIDDEARLRITSGVVELLFDTDDALRFIRSSNTLAVRVGGTDRLTVTASAVTCDVVLAAPQGMQVDASFSASILSSKPTHTFDAGDYVEFNRSANTWEWFTGSGSRAVLSASVFSHVSEMSAPKLSVDANLFLNVSGGNAILRLDDSDEVRFNRSSNTLQVVVGSLNRMNVSETSIAAFVPLKHNELTVATLPAGENGMRAFVTDATSPVWGSSVAGGGAVKVPVYYDGTSWKVG